MFSIGFHENKLFSTVSFTDQNHNFGLACICFVSLVPTSVSVSVLKYLRCVNEYFAGFVASYLCLAE